jgi:predicted nucleic-acid-binding Zn-ribbon protein
MALYLGKKSMACLHPNKHYLAGRSTPMISCPKCGNDTRTSGLVTAQGDVMLAGTIGTDPRPILAQVCTACGYIELYAPLMLEQPEAGRAEEGIPNTAPEMVTTTA